MAASPSPPLSPIAAHSFARRAVDIAILPRATLLQMTPFMSISAACRRRDPLLRPPTRTAPTASTSSQAVSPRPAESGVSVPRLGDWKHTAFRSHFSTFYSDRYLTAPSVSLIQYALSTYLRAYSSYWPPTNMAAVEYTTATPSRQRATRLSPGGGEHEFGHSFGGLADTGFSSRGAEFSEDSYPFDVEPGIPTSPPSPTFASKWGTPDA